MAWHNFTPAVEKPKYDAELISSNHLVCVWFLFFECKGKRTCHVSEVKNRVLNGFLMLVVEEIVFVFLSSETSVYSVWMLSVSGGNVLELQM